MPKYICNWTANKTYLVDDVVVFNDFSFASSSSPESPPPPPNRLVAVLMSFSVMSCLLSMVA